MGVKSLAGALSGVRVLEMANVISGPFAGMLLADMGADVVKVEMPGGGDVFRIWDGGSAAMSPHFASYNRGKRSVTVDVRKPGGRDVYLRLAREVDVVLENFRPGTLDRMGVGWNAVNGVNPAAVYCAITGMGSDGPYRDRPTFDAIAQAMSGLWSQLTRMDGPEPVGPPICDQLTGLYAAYAVVAALFRRAASGGGGERIEVSMLGAALAFQTSPVADYLMQGRVADQTSRARRSQSYAFVAGDGLPLAVHLSTPQKFWTGFATAVGRPDLVADERFRTKADRIRNYALIQSELDPVFRTRPRADWLRALEAQDVPAAPINDIGEALADPQVEHLGMVATFGAGTRALPLVGFPWRLQRSPCEPGLPPPEAGEHTDAILAQAGFTAAEVAELRRQSAV